LYHYAHPCWFEDLGGFQKEENLKYFERFCKTVFEQLDNLEVKVRPIFLTFSSFIGYAFPAYFIGEKPPFKKDFQFALQVLKNMLQVHVNVYRTLKNINPAATIGLHKTVFPTDPYNLCNPFDLLYSWMGNNLSNYSIYNFFKTGIFKVWMPTKGSIYYENKDAIGALDCIGLTYYSASFAKNGKIISRPECIPTENERYTIYPEGFYRTLKSLWKHLAKPLSVPIYVTETGIAARNAEERDLFFRRHLYALQKAMCEGVQVKSYCVWSLMDNFEWSQGYTKKYGICSVDFETQERTLKDGIDFLINVVKNHT